MFIVSKADREKVVACLRNGKIDGVAISDDQLVDEIIRVMNRKGYLQGISSISRMYGNGAEYRLKS
ncbi:MAG: hypothetical protein LBS72_00505 [Oscillospiraceae bacterium]|jgi:hypothetical protein|nr:hypothetical protein [Oscillospiraceae bacterium]